MADATDAASTPTDIYTHGHHESVLRGHSWRTAANSAGYVLPHLSAGQTLLDVGCGPGTITVDLAEIVAPGQVTAIEVGDDILDKARQAAEERGVQNITFEVGDVYELAHDDDSFDVTHAHQVLQHLSDPVAALREMKRVTKPGGIVAVRDADYDGMFWAPADPRLDRWMDTYRRVAKHNNAEPDGARHLVGWARAAGLANVVPTGDAWVFATPDDRAYWGGQWVDRATSSAFAQQAVDYGFATAADLAEFSQAFADWTEQPDGWFAIVHGELICRVD
ncbi:MAG: ubiquinone/menaquinone biosynthesis C-methylase UbiE [Acidimicrobiales bacterium]|jgi:ubiquinone/menaquinone biosynthesis C-methylase UbiE